ncbi:biosynthetic-type acetolactate synthase large subunit [Cupriavidus consociatus]|uniref:biosynthetic-type acetolactate synthase large subunit n=1 Tax=Cupriavidus consociatus TaxID=2821357 RepID=UPI001AE5D8BB|nr:MULTISPECIES: biosynthetic-type acetolactate synthase large subunit [unclassified Cupriavidus]MBP0625414.1 biosynthetic-type acetolactate synthase large subunit [Cupriavidus sp. LEh25]MDK2662155.1 biosynthetic-type acetolactate synthase large subunit [Cupriavidus sp. LEh21]
MNRPSPDFCPRTSTLQPRILSGAEMIVEALLKEGVRSVWGYPGGAVLPIYDAIARQSTLRHLLVRHEQAAVHAADGYARATGNVGVALVTSGPGVTNAVTGIATAYFDSIPLVILSGNVPQSMIGEDAFQECDAVGITRPVVKHNYLVTDVKSLPQILKKAFHLARTGRPGPVLVDIPKDVSLSSGAFEYPNTVDIRSYRPAAEGHEGQIRHAARLLKEAHRPYLYVGGGVIAAKASGEILELAALINAPVTTTLMALGAFPGTDRRYLGMPGMHGTYEANRAMQECDVLLAVGARFDDRVIGNVEHFCSTPRQIIHIDIDPTTIGKRVKPTVPIVGDARRVLRRLVGALGEAGIPRNDHGAWWATIEEWRSKRCLAYDLRSDSIKPQYVIETLRRIAPSDAMVCSDVGQHQMWAAQHYRFSAPRQWLNSGGLGTMGVGLPYAMGAKQAFPQREVFAITGDGSIQMCIQELSTCKQYDLPVKIICLNNGYLGMVKQLQHVEYEQRYSQSYMDALPDFPALARAYGHIGFTVRSKNEVETALRDAIAEKKRTVFLDIHVDPSENVWPMIRGGHGLDMMLIANEPINS